MQPGFSLLKKFWHTKYVGATIGRPDLLIREIYIKPRKTEGQSKRFAHAHQSGARTRRNKVREGQAPPLQNMHDFYKLKPDCDAARFLLLHS